MCKAASEWQFHLIRQTRHPRPCCFPINPSSLQLWGGIRQGKHGRPLGWVLGDSSLHGRLGGCEAGCPKQGVTLPVEFWVSGLSRLHFQRGAYSSFSLSRSSLISFWRAATCPYKSGGGGGGGYFPLIDARKPRYFISVPRTTRRSTKI